DSTRSLHARKFRHLNVEHAQARTVFQSKLNRLLAVSGLYDGRVRGELSLQNLAQVTSLRHVVFGNQYGHAHIVKLRKVDVSANLLLAALVDRRRTFNLTHKLISNIGYLLCWVNVGI